MSCQSEHISTIFTVLVYVKKVNEICSFKYKKVFFKERLNKLFFQEWEADPAVSLVLIKGAGDRAFCAGGDVRGEFELSVPTTWDHIYISGYDYSGNISTFHWCECWWQEHH